MLCGRPREEKGGERGRPAGSPPPPAGGLTTPAPRPAGAQLGEGEHQLGDGELLTITTTTTPRPPRQPRTPRAEVGGWWLRERRPRLQPPGFSPRSLRNH